MTEKIELTEQQQQILDEIKDKLKRSTTYKSDVVITKGENLGALGQYNVEARAFIKDTRKLSPSLFEAEQAMGKVDPVRTIAKITHADLTMALTLLRDVVK